MASARTLKRLDNLIWTLIFGGLLVLVLGIASHDEARIAGWSLSVLGGIVALVGFVLIYVRSRLPQDAPSQPGPENRA